MARSPARFPSQFVKELSDILNSEALRSHYDGAGNAVESRERFTGSWVLESLDFEPGTDRQRVVANFTSGGRVVRAVVDAGDFLPFIRGGHDPAFNPTGYSDLSYYVSILLMEYILTRDSPDVAADEIRIRSPL